MFGQVEVEASGRASSRRQDVSCTRKVGQVSICETRGDEENTRAGQGQICSEEEEKTSWPGLEGPGEKRNIKSAGRMFGALIIADQATEFQVFKGSPPFSFGAQ